VDFAAKLMIAVGSPIGGGEKFEHPTQDQINQLHTQYLQQIEQLYHKHKKEAGYGQTPFRFTSEFK
jgi:hypothetical protein